jgi:uncharacterized membrane protein
MKTLKNLARRRQGYFVLIADLVPGHSNGRQALVDETWESILTFGPTKFLMSCS